MTNDRQVAGTLQMDNLTDITFESPFMQQLEGSGRPTTLEKVIPVVSQKEGDENTAYLVHAVRTLLLPEDSEALDVVAHEVTVWLCPCPHFHHRIRPSDVNTETVEGLVHPTDNDKECKHIRCAKYHDPDVTLTLEGQQQLFDNNKEGDTEDA